MRSFGLFLLLGACLSVGSAGAAEPKLEYDFRGGDHLSVFVAGADQQLWKVFPVGNEQKILVAAVKGGRLILEEFTWDGGPRPGPGPGPEPGPQPGPEPQPQPTPGPKSVIWIEETGERTPQQAAALTDPKLRAALTTARWTLRVADVDVVDETGRPPSDLAPYLERARQAGLPWLVILENGRELYTGKAPPDLPSLLALLRRYGLPWPADETEASAGRRLDAAPSPAAVAAPQDCPQGTCPAPAVRTPRWRIVR